MEKVKSSLDAREEALIAGHARLTEREGAMANKVAVAAEKEKGVKVRTMACLLGTCGLRR